MSSEDELRIAVSRRLLLEDALWIGDVLASASEHRGRAQVFAPLLLSGHASRIVYEGRLLLEARDPQMALPDFVAMLPPATHPSIALARHATKMLDNQNSKDKTLTDFEKDVHNAWMSQQSLLRRGVRPGFKWMQKDMGFYTLGDRVVGSTIALHLRFGLNDVRPDTYPEFFQRFGYDLAASVRVYSYLSGETDAISTTQDMAALDEVGDNDRFVERYLEPRYDSRLSPDQKLLLLLIESEVNTATTLIPLVSRGHQNAAFRARLISLWHGLSSLVKILDASPTAISPATGRMRSIVKSSPAQTLLASKEMRRIRNRCVHYEIPRTLAVNFTDAPMFGIIESLSDQTLDSLDTLIGDLGSDLSESLRDWRNG